MVSDIRPDASEDGEWGSDWRRCKSGIRQDKKGTFGGARIGWHTQKERS